MSQRPPYEPNSNNRFTRARSPTRNPVQGIHPSRANYVDSRPKDTISPDPPRGPRALTESHRGYGPPPPRGRGFQGRADYRSDHRDREYFRRDPSPPGTRRRSPHTDRFSSLDYRDYRDGPRDFEFGRGRRGFRDSTPGRYGVEGRGGQSYHPARDDPPRGRGRIEWTPRGRGRPGFHDDRLDFRDSSRSPPPRIHRRERSLSRERWPTTSSRADEFRPERRDAERSSDRDERSRDEVRFRSDRFPSDSRYLSTTHNSIDVERPSDSANSRILREAPDRPQSKVDESHTLRASSPPRAPEVPAFGSSQPRWNQWVAPEQKQAPSSPPFRSLHTHPAPPPELKPPSPKPQHTSIPQLESRPTQPTAGLDSQQIAPKGPKAARQDPSSTSSDPLEARSQTHQESPKLLSSLLEKPGEPPLNAPTGPAWKPPSAPRDPSPSTLRSPPVRPRQIPGVPSGPKASVSPLASRQAPSSPGFNPPAGPRAAPPTSSPSGSSVPTGPRANRTNSTNARTPIGPGHASWQWTRPDAHHLNGRSSSIPAKRSIAGEIKGECEGEVQLPDRNGAHSPGPFHRSNEIDPSMKIPKLDGSETLESTRTDTQPENEEQDLAANEAGSEEDAMEIDDDDAAKHEHNFQLTRSRLQAKITDLSSERLRGLSPIRKLNLLSRLSLEDPSEFLDPPRSRKPTVPNHKELKSPEMEQNISDLEYSEQPSIDGPATYSFTSYSPSPVSTPEIIALPFLNTSSEPLFDFEALEDPLEQQQAIRQAVSGILHRRHDSEKAQEEVLRFEYARRYREYRERVKILDEENAKKENVKEDIAEVNAPKLAVESTPPVQTPQESTRKNRTYATEHDFELALEWSRKEAEQAAEQRRKQDAAHAKPNWEQEARVPDLLRPDGVRIHMFSESTCLKDPRELCLKWELQPPEDDFTKEEHDVMLQSFKDFPKKFGKIADGLEDRTYKDCINHYYATKWNGQYKPPRDKRKRPKNPKVKTGPNQRPRANALISNLEEGKPDQYDADDTSALPNVYTESGRPKRAAAPTFKDKEQGEQAGPLTTPARKAAKGEQVVERAPEKPGRKPRTSNKEQRPRKSRNGVQTKHDSKSPEKFDGAGESGQAASHDIDTTNSLAVPTNGRPPLLQRLGPEHDPSFTVEPPQSHPPLLPEAGKIHPPRARYHPQASSYWSVPETELFPKLLAKYGTDWTSIAQEMRNKTHTMIKNYYGRLRNKDSEIENTANAANERRANGEQLPISVSTPSITNRKPKESNQPTQPRALAPTSEVIDLEEDDQGTGKPNRQPVAGNSIMPSAAPSGATEGQNPHERPTSFESQQKPRAPFQTSPGTYSSATQSSTDDGRPAQLESIRIQSTPTNFPIDYRSQLAPTQNVPTRATYTPGQPKTHFEDLFSRPQPRMGTSGPPTDSSNIYGSISTQSHTVGRPQQDDRGVLESAQPPRAPSPQPPTSMRHLMDQSAARAQSNAYTGSGPQSIISSSVRHETRSNPPVQERPPQPPAPQTRPEPRKSTIMSILNTEEPEEPRPRHYPPTAPTPNPTPPQYGAGPRPPSSYPPRPPSQMERRDYSHDHSRNASLTYNPTFPPSAHQPPRTNVELRTNDGKLAPGTFHIEWPIQSGRDAPSETNVSVQDHRSSMHHLFDSRYKSSPPPFPHCDSGSGSGTDSPFHQRVPMQHLTARHEPSPPSSRPYAYPPPPSHTHSRETSISHLNSASRAPPPSILQPQQPSRQPSTSISSQQQQASMQPVMQSRGDPLPPSYMPREMPRDIPRDIPRELPRERPREPPSYAAPREISSRTFYQSEPNFSAYAHNSDAHSYESNEKPRVWGVGSHGEDRNDRRTADWTRGLPREAHYGPVGPTQTAETPQSVPPQAQQHAQPQYAPYRPLNDRTRERER